MGSLIFAVLAIFVAIFPYVLGILCVMILYFVYGLVGIYILKKAEKWFDYSGKKTMVLNICLNILVSK
ncbi:hypothetical protein EHE19_008460 [Ruminiclostridium herbifermentans]|uniref:Uncharacterized protein n=1 Tax=Ruminiclostridium herbifermentans TaxID=2488810 RepID=A0A7H1VSQ6_9FIRM|nr:hypothetical protein EHE19_008460 [Ruminiclostridium herbifermentans]